MNKNINKCSPYPESCVVQNISPKGDINKRYSLEVAIKSNNSNDKSMATVIMMNPSKATEICSDDTVNKVLKFFKIYKSIPVKKVIILNLFPYYETDSKKLAKCVAKNNSTDLQTNINMFKNYIGKSNLIVLAWGNVPSGFSAKTHNEYVKKTMDIIEKAQKNNIIYVFKNNKFKENQIITKKQRPRHPNRITLDDLHKIKTYSYNRGLLKIKLK